MKSNVRSVLCAALLAACSVTAQAADGGAPRVDAWGGTPEDFGKLIHSEVMRFGKAVNESGAKADQEPTSE